MFLTRVAVSDNFMVDYDRDRGMYRVSIFEDGHYKDEFWFDAYGEKECQSISNEWIKLYEQTPPVNKEVELKIIRNSKEIVQINKLIPMMTGVYRWMYCDYDDDNEEVIAWRKIVK